MDKIEYIDEYIDRCDVALCNKHVNDAKILEEEILGVFSSEIPNIKSQLDLYTPHMGGEDIDYLGDIKILKQKLINYKINLQGQKEKMMYDLELARLQQPQLVAHAESNQSQSSSINVDITIEQTLRQINEIAKENLDPNDKEKLKDYLYSLEGIKASKDKNKFWDKTKEVLRFLADKGADAAITMLPYIIQALSTLN